MIRLANVKKSVAEGPARVDILRGVDLSVEPGEVLGILGPSGSGKSTLLHLIAGVDYPNSGEIEVNDVSLSGMDRTALARFRRENIGLIFQSYHLLPDVTALQNVEVPLLLAGVPRSVARTRALEFLDKVGLSGRANHLPEALSGGEQQRVAIARALVGRPAILLADEPTGALDSKSGSAALDLLLRLREEAGATLLIVTHEPSVVQQCRRVVRLRDGRIVDDQRVA